MADEAPDDPALVFASDAPDAPGPGTHVLLAGIGHYDFLINGE